ncbi:DUF6296 family protein [Yinghuangia seranimata]|uniref:DUF6296 family protein n=1 Tax=Yinghuangia seranimata TaxID=408067 RepID=UPI00248CFB67|nr:DUF6296 family protein [Yinghuangia seranimata]MDI2125948.1 DUF6296 family protein [Yinghuangia seranimata]
MTDAPERCAVSLPGRPGTHAAPTAVIVRLTGGTGPQGEPEYAAEDGTLVVRVTGDVAQVVAGADEYQGQLLAVVPVA